MSAQTEALLYGIAAYLILYGALTFLPTGRGRVYLSGFVSLFFVGMTMKAAFAPSTSAFVDFTDVFLAAFGAVFTCAAIAAFLYHLFRQSKGHSWMWRLALAALGVFAGYGIVAFGSMP